MKVVGLNHHGIRTAKLEASRHFYEDLLGLEKDVRPSTLPSQGYWLYAGESPIIHLVEDSTGSINDPNIPRTDLTNAGGETHLTLTVEKARGAVDRLIEADVPYWDRLFKTPIMYQVFVEDPNGLLIELIDHNPGEITGPIFKIND